MERVGFGYRLLAAFIDSVILGLTSAALLYVALPSLKALIPSAESLTKAYFVPSFFSLCYTLLEVFRGATPGKMVLRLQIRNEDGTPGDIDRLAKRWAFKELALILQVVAAASGVASIFVTSNAISLLVVISALFMLNASRQALYDRWFGTAVFALPEAPSTAAVASSTDQPSS